MSKDDKSPESLDFTEVAEAKSRAATAPRPKPARSAEREKPRGGRRIAVPVLIVIAIGVVVVFAMREEAPPPAPSAPAKPAAPAYQAPPAQKPAQTYPPPTKLQPQPQTSAPPSQPAQLEKVRTMPPEFLKAVQDYNTKAGHKAIALALDDDGKWAYGAISGWATQQGANEEALSECALRKPKSAVQASCKLFAVGDKVVW